VKYEIYLKIFVINYLPSYTSYNEFAQDKNVIFFLILLVQNQNFHVGPTLLMS